VVGVVAASHFIPKSLTEKMREISQAFGGLQAAQDPEEADQVSYMMAS